jgi:hypothetical protein
LYQVDIGICISDDECFGLAVIGNAAYADIGKPLNFCYPGNAVVILIEIEQRIRGGCINPVPCLGNGIGIIIGEFVSPLPDGNLRSLAVNVNWKKQAGQ